MGKKKSPKKSNPFISVSPSNIDDESSVNNLVYECSTSVPPDLPPRPISISNEIPALPSRPVIVEQEVNRHKDEFDIAEHLSSPMDGIHLSSEAIDNPWNDELPPIFTEPIIPHVDQDMNVVAGNIIDFNPPQDDAPVHDYLNTNETTEQTHSTDLTQYKKVTNDIPSSKHVPFQIDTNPMNPPALQLNSETLAIPPTPVFLPQTPPPIPARPSSRASLHTGTYQLKHITYLTRHIKILTQTHNGPCPLIALMNVLIINETITIPYYLNHLSFDSVLEILYEFIITRKPDLDWDALKIILQKMENGLDVNVEFDGGFEHNEDIDIFKAFDVQILHGWIVDSNDEETVRVIVKNCVQYNRALELCVEAKEIEERMAARMLQRHDTDKFELIDSDILQRNNKRINDAIVINTFLEQTANQLTVSGLVRLDESISEGEVTVLFRNNHFMVLVKHDGKLITLVTDQGYSEEVVWETLDNIEGDSQYLDCFFNVYRLPRVFSEQDALTEDQDRIMAQSLQIEEDYQFKKAQRKNNLVSAVSDSSLVSSASKKKKKDCLLM